MTTIKNSPIVKYFQIVDFQKKRLWWLALFIPQWIWFLSLQINNISSVTDGFIQSIFAFGYLGIFCKIFGIKAFRLVFWRVFLLFNFVIHIVDDYYGILFSPGAFDLETQFFILTLAMSNEFIYFAFLWLYVFESKNIWEEKTALQMKRL
ncbi:hypothetical protein [Algicola sagamiensis]|uniref:hypothetical protein n=1 Tax=Algicola sagamiensis TaxID=163869 RepID=UPI00035CE31E|nr:hypothetical protein [Algicola sagamiensis]